MPTSSSEMCPDPDMATPFARPIEAAPPRNGRRGSNCRTTHSPPGPRQLGDAGWLATCYRLILSFKEAAAMGSVKIETARQRGKLAPLKLEHAVLRTTRLQAMVEWYTTVLQAEVAFRNTFIAFLW